MSQRLADGACQLLRSQYARMLSRSHCLNRSPELTGSLRVYASRQQGGADATEHVP